MMRFALLEFLITAGVLYAIYRISVWIYKINKKRMDSVDNELNKKEK